MRRRDYVKVALTDSFCLYMLTLGAIVFVTTALLLMGLTNVAYLVSYGGTSVVVFGTIVYVAARDPDGKFPNVWFGERLAKVLSFQRR